MARSLPRAPKTFIIVAGTVESYIFPDAQDMVYQHHRHHVSRRTARKQRII